MSQILKDYQNLKSNDSTNLSGLSGKEAKPDRYPAPFKDHASAEFLSMSGEEEKAYYDQIYNSLYPLQKTALTAHAIDLQRSAKHRSSWRYRFEALPIVALFKSMFTAMYHASMVLINNPMAPVTDTTNWLYAVVAYTLIYVTLFIVNCGLVAMQLLGVPKIISYFSRTWGSGYTMIAWADTTMYDKQRKTVDSARKVLSGNPEDYLLPLKVRSHPDMATYAASYRRHLEFNVDVAKTILLMSSIVYERNTTFVQKAADYPDSARLYLLKSEEFMYRLGVEWGCQFISVADFQNVSGPFAGAFYNLDNEGNPFMVVVFKGTSPEALTEWITDATFDQEMCIDALGMGFAHSGFYSSLFPSANSGAKMWPYMRIIETVKMVAQRAYDNQINDTGPKRKLNLFVGGHSLGAGMASLFYARLLESPGDLGENIVLRDAYCFGTPRACGAKLASRVEYNLRKPENLGRTLWRVANRSSSRWIGDVVTRVPPGLADRRENRANLKEGSLLSYAAIGVPIDLTPNRIAPFYTVGDVPSGYQVKVVKALREPEHELEDAKREESGFFPPHPIAFMDKIMSTAIPMLHDHFPGSYFAALRKVGAQVFDKSDSPSSDGKTPSSPQRALGHESSRANKMSPETHIFNLGAGNATSANLTAG